MTLAQSGAVSMLGSGAGAGRGVTAGASKVGSVLKTGRFMITVAPSRSSSGSSECALGVGAPTTLSWVT